MVDPVENLSMPEQTVLLLEHPMVLIREVEEPGWDATSLEDVKQREAVTLRETVILGVVNDELRRGPVGNVILGIPLVICGAGFKDAAVVIVADEPQLLRCEGTLGVGNAVVSDEGLELIARSLAWIQLVMYPPYEAPAAIPFSVSIHLRLVLTYFQAFTRSKYGQLPHSPWMESIRN